MAELVANLMTFLGGVLGALVGFFVIVGTAAFLMLPYWMMRHERGERENLKQRPERDELNEHSSLI